MLLIFFKKFTNGDIDSKSTKIFLIYLNRLNSQAYSTYLNYLFSGSASKACSQIIYVDSYSNLCRFLSIFIPDIGKAVSGKIFAQHCIGESIVISGLCHIIDVMHSSSYIYAANFPTQAIRA